MARLIEVTVKVGRGKSVWSRRDDGGFAGARQGLANARIGIKGFVGDQLISRHLRQQRVGANEIVGLSRGQQKGERNCLGRLRRTWPSRSGSQSLIRSHWSSRSLYRVIGQPLPKPTFH
jgi:hypothetical protein